MNEKLSQAIIKGKELQDIELKNKREQIIQNRLKSFLKDNWIYEQISLAIKDKKQNLKLYNSYWYDFEEITMCKTALNRIEGLNCEIKLQSKVFPDDVQYYYLEVKWLNL